MIDIIKEVREELKNNIDEKTQSTAENYFKKEIKYYGVKVPVVNKIAAQLLQKYLKDAKKDDIFKLCSQLWESGYLEESFVACVWSYALHAQYEKKDFKYFEYWLKNYTANWASCDTLCNHTIAELIEMFPEHIKELKKWAKDKNRWARRGSAVTLIIPARKGLFLKDIFEIADTLLTDDDDMVRKGYGWMLKAASEARQKEVFNYVMKNKKEMPRTALRYAIEKMPADLKKKAMEK